MRIRPATPKQLALGNAYPGKVRLDDEFARTAPPNGRYIRDALVNRLLFRAGPRKRGWYLQHGKGRRLGLGEWPTLSTDGARERAIALIHGRSL